MEIYLDGLAHKADYFLNEEQRDRVVKELRKDRWTVKIKCFSFPDPTLSTVFAYEATK